MLGEHPDDERTGAGGLNDYATSDNAPTITVANPVQIDKAFHPNPAKSTYTIGETFSYRLKIDLIEGSVADLIVTDTLPTGVRFESASVGVGHVGMTTQFDPPPATSGQTLTFALGDVANPANGKTDDDFITIDIQVVVENRLPANVNGAVLGNHAALTYTGPNGTVIRDYDADADQSGVQPLDLTLVEPTLELTKTLAPTEVPPGDLATYTLLIDHTAASRANAYDLVVKDTLPAGLTYVAGSASVPVTVNGRELTFQIAALTLGDDHTSITYRVRVDLDAPFGQPLTNTAALGYSSQPGQNPDERAYTDSATAHLLPKETSHIEALKTVAIVQDGAPTGVANSGDTLEYSILLDNQSGPADNVVFTDAIPLSTTYVTGSLTTSRGTINASDPTQMRVLIDRLEDGDQVTIRFRVTIDAFIPSGTIISNQGLVDSDQTVPEPTDQDGQDANGDQPTTLPVGDESGGARLRVEKLVEWLADTDTSKDVSPTDTLVYRLVLRNTSSEALTNVSLTDSIPSGLTYLTGSIQTTAGSAEVNGQIVSVTGVASIAAGGSVTVSFTVTVNNTETFVNQATATSEQTGAVTSDGNPNPNDGHQPTQITAVEKGTGRPQLSIGKRAELARDANGDGQYNPGETVRYVILVENKGSALATEVVLDDSIPSELTLVTGSASTSRGTVVTESPVLRVNIGDLQPAEQAEISFLALIPATTAVGTVVTNLAQADSLQGPPVRSGPVDVTIMAPNVWDPPSGYKTVNAAGYPELLWQMVWINSGNQAAVLTLIEDPIPKNTRYVDGSLECIVAGASISRLCEYDASAEMVRFIGDIAPDPGATDESTAMNEVLIRFRTTVQGAAAANQASAYWDADGDGFILDDQQSGQSPAHTDDPGTDTKGDSTRWQMLSNGIPTLSGWAMFLLVILLSLVASRHQGLRQRYRR